MVAVTDLARRVADAEARAVPAADNVRCRLVVGVPTLKAIGFKGGGTEEVIDERSGWPELREKLTWLPRSQIRLVAGEYEPDREVEIEVPRWLARRNGLA